MWGLNCNKIQIKDINYYKECYINQNESIGKTYQYMFEKNITGVPIVDKDKKTEKERVINKLLSEQIYD